MHKKEGNEKSTEVTSEFYEALTRDGFDDEIKKKKDDIDQKSTGFFIFRAIRRIYPHKEIDSVVDVGGNYGIFLKILSDEFLIKRKFCLDIADPINKVKDIEYLIGPAEQTLKNLKQNSVDIVLLQDVIEHIFDPDRLVLNIKTILKEGGVIIVSTPNLSSLINRFALLFGFEPMSVEVSTKAVFGRPGSNVVGHIRNFTYRAIQDFFKYYGFQVLEQFTYVSYLSEDSTFLSKLIHSVDKASRMFGRKYRSQIFLVVRK